MPNDLGFCPPQPFLGVICFNFTVICFIFLSQSLAQYPAANLIISGFPPCFSHLLLRHQFLTQSEGFFLSAHILFTKLQQHHERRHLILFSLSTTSERSLILKSLRCA